MDQRSDFELLRRYAVHGSNEAFETLVRCHLGMVRATALRRLGNVHQAEEVCHAVFLALARKAGSLPEGTVVAGWLFRAAQFAAAKLARDEERRERNQREAAMTHADSLGDDETNEIWERMVPLLDEGLESLGETDRAALLLRYFQDRPFGEVGSNLGTSEAAAKMRVGRAVEKLREFFRRRGVAVGAAALSTILSARAAETAADTLATTVSLHAVSAGASAAKSMSLADSILQGMASTKTRKLLAVLAMTALIGTLVVVVGSRTRWFGLAPPPVPPAGQPWP